MKSVLLYVHDDAGLESRLQAALAIVRSTGGHLECVTAKPLASLMISDPVGETFVISTIMEAMEEGVDRAREAIERRMVAENISWSLVEGQGEAALAVVQRAQLADLIILSLGHAGAANDAISANLVGDIALSSHIPILAIPDQAPPLKLDGVAMIAWNGSQQVANAVRAAVPLLARAQSVHLVTVDEEERPELPAADAALYLSRYAIDVDLHRHTSSGQAVGDVLGDATGQLGADWLVMGAFGHGRLREWLFGGVTREFLDRARIPTILAH